MAFEVKTEVDPIQFTLPKPDGTKIAFSLPPLDYIPRKTMEKYKKWVKENSRIATEDEANLELLKLILDDATYKLVAGYPTAVARQITEELSEKSQAKLGESGASTSS